MFRLPQLGLFFFCIVAMLVASQETLAQEDCGFLNAPDGLTAGCLDSCVWVVPDFERAAETTSYALDSIAYAPPLDLGSGTLQTSFSNNFSNNIDLPFGFSFFDNDFFAIKNQSEGFFDL